MFRVPGSESKYSPQQALAALVWFPVAAVHSRQQPAAAGPQWNLVEVQP